MKKKYNAPLPVRPIFCKSCGLTNTWERMPRGDIKTVSGVVKLERWNCRVCGETTLWPTCNPSIISGDKDVKQS